jgi:hypothetical protein
MSFITSFYAGTHIARSNYPQDFAPVRFTSTKDRHGSVYVYRLLNRDCTIIPHSKRRQSLPSFTTVFTGCVQSIVYDVSYPSLHTAPAHPLILIQAPKVS